MRFIGLVLWSMAWICLAPLCAQSQVSGTLLDRASGHPLAGALVSLQARGIRTTTAADGSFSLPEVSGSNLVLVGAHKAYISGSVRITTPVTGVSIQLDPVPQEDNPEYEFRDPAFCGMCHPDQIDHWTNSAMAATGLNRWVYDLFDGTGTPGGSGGWVYTRDSVHAGLNPNSECASCHQPEPWIGAPHGALDDIDAPSVGATHGVSCEVCHKIAHVDESRVNFPGIFPGVVTVTRPEGGDMPPQVIYGVLGDSDYNNRVWMRASYQPQLVGAACATCHQDKNDPDDDGDFEEENGVVSEPTWEEWLASPYADTASPLFGTCVDCHMPSYGATNISTAIYPPLLRDPETIRSHWIEGTTAAYLDSAVDLEMTCDLSGDSLDAQIRITNSGAGHHVPTGSVLRNMILLVDAHREADGIPLDAVSGPAVGEAGGVGDPDQGYFAGLPGKLYAKISHDAAGNGPVFFTEATGILADTRIPALSTDTTRYVFRLPAGGGTVSVRARLIYRRAFRSVVDAKGWTTDGRGRPLEDIQGPNYGHLMADQEWSSAVLAAPEELPSGGNSSGLSFALGPNPTRGGVSFQFRLASPAHVRLTIHDPRGRSVIRLVDGDCGTSEQARNWDGKDGRGSAVPSGVYLCRLEVAGRTEITRRLTVLK